MQRRRFLKGLLAALGVGAAAAVDPDLLTWEPGRKTFIDAPAGGWRGASEAEAQAALRFHRDAFKMVSPGISMRFIREFDAAKASQFVNRLDILYGMAAISPAYALTVVGSGPVISSDGLGLHDDRSELDRFAARAGYLEGVL